VAKLTDGETYLCKAPNSRVPDCPNVGVHVAEFEGPHPAGTSGLHIHLLAPVHRERTVWTIDYQDVIAIGSLIKTGKLDLVRVISLAGPKVKNPRLFRTRFGASTDDLVAGRVQEGNNRVVAGSVLAGRQASGDVLGYLGRYHRQICVLEEGNRREFLGWLAPGKEKYSNINLFVSRLFRKRRFAITTALHGSKRPMVPINLYEQVMPFDIQPTFLLRALVVGDLEESEKLGCMELDEEDLALCSFVCPSKYDYGVFLRSVLTQIEKEG